MRELNIVLDLETAPKTPLGQAIKYDCLGCSASLSFPPANTDNNQLTAGITGQGIIIHPENKRAMVGILYANDIVATAERKTDCEYCHNHYTLLQPITSLMAVSQLRAQGWNIVIGLTQ